MATSAAASVGGRRPRLTWASARLTSSLRVQDRGPGGRPRELGRGVRSRRGSSCRTPTPRPRPPATRWRRPGTWWGPSGWPGVRSRAPARRPVHRAAPLPRGCGRRRVAGAARSVVADDRGARRPRSPATRRQWLSISTLAATGSARSPGSEHPTEVTVPQWRALVAEVLDASRRSTHEPAVTLASVLDLLEAGEGLSLAEVTAADRGLTRWRDPAYADVVGEVRRSRADCLDRHRRHRRRHLPPDLVLARGQPSGRRRRLDAARWTRWSPTCWAWSATARAWNGPTRSCARR